MSTRNVVLTDYHDKVIDRLVKSGKYQNASEVIREGVRLVHDREKAQAAKLKALREAAQKGFEAIENGDYFEFTSRQQIRDHLEKVAKKARSRRS